MIGKNEKLRKTSDEIFQEAEPPNDRGRPLEWRRSFNFVSLPLKNVQVANSCTIHDTDFDLNEERKTNPVDLIKPNVTTKTTITGILDEEKARDSIYFAVKNKQDGDTYSIERHRGETKITLKSGEPTEAGKNTPAGLYWGNAFRMNFDPSEDDLCFELSMPEKQINSLVAYLRADENAVIEVGARLLSFTFEVDDALREPYHPKDIVINDSTLCFASWAEVTSRIGQHNLQHDSELEEEETNDEHHEEPTLAQRAHQELLQAITSYSKPLSSLVTAIWALIIVIALYAFFR